ncbi:MAG TPA: DUF438 domain-containing protein [Terriglobales bacterium]|nr:DUF438 domain-containing protein [Terriglobales bacterium]
MSELIDNRAQRVSTLKQIIQHLHSGAAPDAVRHRLRELVRQTDATEIMAMEQELIRDGMPVEEIRSMCDLHSQVTREILVQLPHTNTIPPGHPLDTFRRENAALAAVISKSRELIAQLSALEGGADASAILDELRQAANELIEVDKHYQRKEHALFSILERHGITGPSKVMWAKDDEVRDAVKDAIRTLRACTPTGSDCKTVAIPVMARALEAVQEMIFKEENILLPMSLQKLTEDEWAEIWAVSPKYGWCLVEPQKGYTPRTAGEQASPGDGTIVMPSGNVTLQQLTAVFSALPLDLTFVDDDDRVAFFTEGPQRIFARSKAIIGRKVQHCHPPRSVETVERILSDFRAGRQNVAEFWINFQGKFIHIRYFAVRDEAGKYMGTLEVTQDITALRALEGERRLLEYASAN